MDRALLQGRLWAWLPTFRVVAELEHVSEAARRLNVSAPAVSRIIRLLEAETDRKLFQRVGRGIELTPAGSELLDAVRAAMRRVDESLASMAGPGLAGSLRVASLEPFTSVQLWRTLETLTELHPRIRVVVEPLRSESDLHRDLNAGRLDVAFVRKPAVGSGLRVERVMASAMIAVAPRERVFNPPPRTVKELSAWPAIETSGDGWPLGLERPVRLRVDDFDHAIEAANALGCVTLVPELLFAHRSREGRALVQLPVKLATRLTVEAVTRPRLVNVETPADALIELARRSFRPG